MKIGSPAVMQIVNRSRCCCVLWPRSTKATPSAAVVSIQCRSALAEPTTGTPITVRPMSPSVRLTMPTGIQSGLGCWSSTFTVE